MNGITCGVDVSEKPEVDIPGLDSVKWVYWGH